MVHFKRAIELFPYYTGEGNAYEPLAEIFEKKGDKRRLPKCWLRWSSTTRTI